MSLARSSRSASDRLISRSPWIRTPFRPDVEPTRGSSRRHGGQFPRPSTADPAGSAPGSRKSSLIPGCLAEPGAAAYRRPRDEIDPSATMSSPSDPRRNRDYRIRARFPDPKTVREVDTVVRGMKSGGLAFRTSDRRPNDRESGPAIIRKSSGFLDFPSEDAIPDFFVPSFEGWFTVARGADLPSIEGWITVVRGMVFRHLPWFGG